MVNLKVNMPVHLLQIDEQSLGKPQPFAGASGLGAWQLLSRCESEDAESCVLLHKIRDMARRNKADARAVLAALDKFIKVVATGQPIENFYDKKQSHPLHEFPYKGQTRVVWRLRKADIRIAFYYAQGKVIFLADALAKREDKLTEREKNQLEREVKIYIDAEESQQLVILTQQGE